MNASKALEGKGYDNVQQSEIIYWELDCKVREHYGVDQPIHLFDGYYIGDADEIEMDYFAKEKGFDGYRELFKAMDLMLMSLANEYPEK